MRRKGFWYYGALAVLLVSGLALAGCSSLFGGGGAPVAPPASGSAPGAAEAEAPAPVMPDVRTQTDTVGWSWRTGLESNRDFDIVKIIVIRNVISPSVELLNEAKELGADSVINIRIDAENNKPIAASGIAIKYRPTYYYGGSEIGSAVFNSGAVNRWSRYASVPNKDYTPAGIITIQSETRTPSADLMEKAAELEAHDIINVLIDLDASKQKIIGASALAVTYKDLPPPPPEN